MASYPYFDLTITADKMEVEAYIATSKWNENALHFSFGSSDQPLAIRLKGTTGAQIQQNADAINAIMDGRAVTIAPEE